MGQLDLHEAMAFFKQSWEQTASKVEMRRQKGSVLLLRNSTGEKSDPVEAVSRAQS